MARAKQPALSDLENQVMRIVWEKAPATAELVRAALEAERPMKDSTVRTILRRLEEKGYVTHDVDGRTYLYSPVVESQNVAADAVKQIIDKLCKGSVESLLVGMVDREVVSPEVLGELAEKIAKAKQTKPNK